MKHGGDTISPVLMLNWPLWNLAFDCVAFNETLGQRARPVRARVVSNVELPIDIEDSNRQPAGLDPQRGSRGNLIGLAKFNPHCCDSLLRLDIGENLRSDLDDPSLPPDINLTFWQ